MALGAQFPANAIPHCCSVISSFTRPQSRTNSLNHCWFWHPTRHMRCMALAMPIMASPRVEEPEQIPGRKTKKEQVHITDKMRGKPMKGLKTLAALGIAGIACASAQAQDAGLGSAGTGAASASSPAAGTSETAKQSEDRKSTRLNSSH